MSDLSYHDVRVTVDGVAYTPSDDYSLELTCFRASGWRLYQNKHDSIELIGGEFDGGEFSIHVRRWWGWARIV